MDMHGLTASPPVGELPDIAISTPPLDELARCWPILEPMLKRATDRVRGYEPIDLLQLAMIGRVTIFVVRDRGAIVAATVTEVRQFPRCRVLEILFCAGTGLRRWIHPLLDALDAQAEALQCVDLCTWDRKGWSRFGFAIAGVALVRRLKD
jgi:hypothetical protein